jgi:outer membrane receptor protein involved in Fe transport
MLYTLLCGTALAFDAGAARAQASGQAGGAHLEEIVVTARKREESLQNVPVAVAVVTSEQLKYNLASDLNKVAELAPQVAISQAGSATGAVIAIRGVSSASNDAGLEQSVLMDFDGVPISRGRIISASIFDMASVQVLEGPQALFFGKNSPAGVISLRSADPTSRPEGYVTAGYEFRSDQAFVEGAVSGPITDTLKGRLAFRGSWMKGWIKNIAGPIKDFINPNVTDPGATWGSRGPDSKDYAVRGTLVWTPGDDFTANLKVLLNSQNRNGGGGTTEPFCINGATQPLLLGSVPLPGADCNKDMVKSHSAVAQAYTVNFPYAGDGNPYLHSKLGLVGLNLNKKFDRFTLASTTGYYSQRVLQLNVSDWSPYASIWATTKESYRLITEELRGNTELEGPINFMAGVYYEHFNRNFFNAPDLFHVFNPKAQNYSVANLLSNTHGDYVSAFAQARWNILPNLELAGGARWSHDSKHIRAVHLASGPTQPNLYPDGVPLLSHYKDSNVSPEATLTWHPDPGQTLYAAYKTGYKAGGLSNTSLVPKTATPANIQFKPEKSKGFEVGYKATLLDRRLRFDLTAYRYNYSNLQVVSYNAALISFTLLNAASSRIQGIEGTGEWLVTDDLTLRGNFGLNSAKYRRFDTAPCYVGQTAATGCIPAAPATATTPAVGAHQDLSGRHLIRAPKLTFMGGADYKLHLVDGWATTISGQASHTSSYNSATDQSPGGHQNGYWLLDASARTGPEDGRWELALIGRNLTNSYYMLETIGWSGSGGASAANQFVGFFNRPREVAVQATVHW